MVSDILAFLDRGGPALWVIAGLSILTLALILWKTWHLLQIGAWSGQAATAAVGLWRQNQVQQAEKTVADRPTLRATLVREAIAKRLDPQLTEDAAREEVAQFARKQLTDARVGLRALDLIATIAPLIGLLGTVLGMITAFQALQTSGAQADAAVLAGGIWEALLTTATGMAVAIPASIALSWFESVLERLQVEMEGDATQIFTRGTNNNAPLKKVA
ncbi:MotA/TolQ/ExbB proton channel family protein [Pseudaestuariivita rosea]|uniref:MotA/TolQ/ExbB proton channel family protein n=1 Tax=Pseudaestuariivita rosea TaxID=2763263 RepID=UPI001ABB880C|nr:MotA/TolQ/ExbB proton channel family protein [Pseudaestuariivita rosea]